MEQIKTYVFDTSYLIEYPESVNNLTGNMVLPSIVLKQLDGLKNSEKEDVARRARAVSYDIMNAQRKNKLKIVSEYEKIDMLECYADNVIVGTAVKLQETCEEVVLLTTDMNMKIAAGSVGILHEGNMRQKRSSSLVPLSSWIASFIISACFIIPVLLRFNSYSSSWIRDNDIGNAVFTSFFLSLLIIVVSALVRKLRRGNLNSNGYVSDYSKKDSDPLMNPIFSNTKGNIYHVNHTRH